MFTFIKNSVFVVVLLMLAGSSLQAQTYYSYQSGNWNASSTWTTDPSGTVQTPTGGPSVINTATYVVLNGRTVTLSANSGLTGGLVINEGATFDLSTFSFTATLSSLAGVGTLRLASTNFPAATSNTFVQAGGGLTEYYSATGYNLSTTQATYNDLRITGNSTKIIARDITVNGNLTIQQGTLQIGNNATARTLTVYGNVTVTNGASFTVGNFNQIHNADFWGDFTNNGTVRFTNQATPNYTAATTTGGVLATFRGLSNNILWCRGTTDWYRFHIDKGTDQTYGLRVLSTNVNNFRVFGPNNGGGNNFAPPTADKAVVIFNGYLRLGNNINIPTFTEGGQDFNIRTSAMLWVDSATVSTTIVGQNGTGYQAATIYGRLLVTSGSFSTGDAAGIVLGDTGSPIVELQNGTIDISQIWAVSGNTMSLIIAGGTFNIRANGEVQGGAMLNITGVNALWQMSGGTLNFLNNPVNAGLGIDFRGTSNITGGTVNVNLTGTNVFGINSTAPFFNFTATRSGAGTLTIRGLNTSQTYFEVLNDATFNTNVLLDLQTNTTGMRVGGNLTMNSGASLNMANGANSEIRFNGTGGTQVATFSFTSPTFTNFVAASAGTVQLVGNNITITQALRIQSGTFDDNGRIVLVSNVLENSGTHIGTGRIESTGGNALTISGNGNGIFQNLYLNHTNGGNGAINTTFTENMRINGTFTMNQNRRVDIGAFNLFFGQSASVVSGAGGFSANRMIIMNGAFDGGSVSRTFSNSSQSFTFPIGSGTAYRPVTTTITSATTWGTVTVRTINGEHPNVTATGRSLSTYWRVTSETFVNPGGISHSFVYPDANLVTGGNVTEAEYRPAYFSRSGLNWVLVGDANDVNDATNTVNFAGIGVIDGEFTAGDDNPTNPFASVNVYYSRATGNWGTNSTWSLNQEDGSGVQNVPPAGALVVLVGNFTVTTNANNVSVSNLTFRPNATLNLAATTGHNFGIVQNDDNTARLRINSANFPGGTWTSFVGPNGGIVEYYSTGSYTVPNAPATYYRLEFNPANAQTITMPAVNLTIYNDFVKSGAGTLQTNASVRTLAVQGNMNITAGTFVWRNNAYTATLSGNLTVSSGATFSGINGGGAATHSLTISGNVTNNGTIACDGTSGDIALTFIGAQNATWTGSATSANGLFQLTINKGNSASSRLDFNVASGGTITATGNVLVLQNGTFRYMSPQTLTLNTNSFTIPATCALENTGSGTLNLVASDNDAADVLLAGSLLVSSGTVNVGLTTNQNFSNDIEYSQAGFPSITVSGGTLFVRGQIRRNTVNQSGSLQFNLSGSGIVRIHGRNPNTTRGNFEILNSGSTFNMSGTSVLAVHRATGGTGIADVLITPDNANVTGGTVILGPDIAGIDPGAQTIDLNASVPIYNLRTMRIANTTTGRLEVNHLVVNNDLTIDANTIFDAQTNTRNVTIGGNFFVGNTYNAGNNITTFNGSGNQTFTMNVAVTIANMVVNKSGGTLTLAGTNNLTVSNSFEIAQGNINDGGRTITIQGNNNINNGTHSSTGSGGLTFTTGAFQTVSGSGAFGNVTLNNANNVTFNGSHTINGNLTFTNGQLIIGANLLTLGVSTTISGVTAARYIRTAGQLSDQGVRKNYPASALNFTFPIGSPSKYTPATINVTANGATGSVTVKPVNAPHPMTTDPANTQLNYYWVVASTGFSGLTCTHTYQYLNADVNGNEASYVAARLFNLAWSSGPAINGTVNAGSDLITLTGVNFISGEYTAGLVAEFGAILTYYSRNNRTNDDWSLASNWSTVGHADNSSPASPPNGNPVQIAAGHTIYMSANNQLAGSLLLNGTLDLGTTSGHNLGTVTGTGVLRIGTTNVVYPGGNFDFFNGPNGGTVEYTANVDQTLPPVASYRNLRFLGTSTKSLPAQDITVYGNVEFAGGNFNSNNRSVAVQGNWLNNSNANAYIPGTSTVSMNGSAIQTIGGSATTSFYRLTINNNNGVNLSNSITVTNLLTFLAGDVNTSASHTLTIGSAGNVTGETENRYVRGQLQTTRTVGAAQASDMGNIGLEISSGPDNLGSVTVTRHAGYAGALANGWNNPIARRWVITSTNPPSSGRNLTFYWYPSEDNGNDMTSVQFARRPTPGSGDFTFVGGAHNVPDTNPRSVTLSTTAFSEWGAGDGNQLPVELINLSLTQRNNKLVLSWATLTEQDNYGFYVQRRMEPGQRFEALKKMGIEISDTWQTLAFVQGAGTSYNPLEYQQELDIPELSAAYQFRLLQEDYNSRTTEFGPIRYEVAAPKQLALKAPYPNPFNPETVIPVTLNADSRLVLEVFDILGRRVATLNNRPLPAGTHLFRFNAQSMASGIYIVRMTVGRDTQIRKITLIR